MVHEVDNPDLILQRKNIYKKANRFIINFFKSNFENLEKDVLLLNENSPLKIPLTIHQIWLGSKIPEHYFNWIKSWKNKDWNYKLWTEDDLKSLKLINQELFDLAENYGEKSDILRLEILYQFGGIYADVDYECLNPNLIILYNKAFDFYAGLEPLEHKLLKNPWNSLKIGNAFLASIPQHPLLEKIINDMKENFKFCKKNNLKTLDKTGPNYVTRKIIDYSLSKTDSLSNMYFPNNYIYTTGGSHLKYIKNNYSREKFPELVGLHYWEGAWLPKK
jgi:mannosyltransferase OCH1-like enzyme